ncbi:MAG: hypothetical protein Q4A85_10925, partial [Kingella sp. (in: b-proteobacteria)]|nr:hypothetical protein [Kingella sp. (in: b-proteobacteria)]
AALRAPSDKRTLFPEKRILCSAGRRGERVAVVNGCDGLGSLKPNPSNIQETVWRDTKRFLFFRLPLPVGND